MATVRKRGSRFEYVVKRQGLLPKPIYLSFDSKEEGDAYCAHLEALLDQGIVPEAFVNKDPGPRTVADLMDEYLKRVSAKPDDQRLLGIARERIGGVRLSAVSHEWAEQWVTDMKRVRHLAPGTIRHHVGAVARCFDWGVRRAYLGTNPLRSLPRGYALYSDEDRKHVAAREDRERDRRLEPGEEAAIRLVLTTEHTPEGRQRPLQLEHREAMLLMLELALETAMRMREIYTLGSKQIDLRKRTIFLDKTKNGDRRQVPLSSVASVVLKRYRKQARRGEGSAGDRLFPFWDGATTPRALAATTSKLSRRWKRVFEHAGCPDLNFHDLRHEATCRLYERTALSDIQIARITGHKSLGMLRRYANLRGSDLAGQLW